MKYRNLFIKNNSKYKVMRNDDLYRIVAATDNVDFVDYNYLDTSRVTSMSTLFAYTTYDMDISEWDTSNVTNMQEMFYYSNTTCDLSNFDTSYVSEMSSMFTYSNKITGLSQWDVSNVTNADAMFYRSKIEGRLDNFIFLPFTTTHNITYRSNVVLP